MKNSTIYIKSRLHLLPGYAEKKAMLLQGAKETSHEDTMERRAVRLSDCRRLQRHRIEDGPDMEVFDDRGQIILMLIPEDMYPETPEMATVDTPSVQYTPPGHDAIAVFVGKPKLAGYRFIAWFLVMDVELFAPNSTALLNKMEEANLSGDPGREWYVPLSQCSSLDGFVSQSYLVSY